MRSIQWPLATPTVRLQSWGEAVFTALKVEVDRKRRPKLASEVCISKATWHLADRRTALQRAGRASTMDVRKARRKFQRAKGG